MKTYTKLEIPKDSAWERKSWRRYTPIWFNEFVTSCGNIIDWLPTIWKDRNWDDYYITKILQRKIELQRSYLVQANRHTNIDNDNKWMTTVLNLIEREHEDYYGMGYMKYIEYGEEFLSMMKDNLADYLAKYPNDVRRVLCSYPPFDTEDTHALALRVSHLRQQRCRNLIFEILKRYSAQWWD